ncbi:uncharacterized protein CBL_01079 [Carabus blaptoides fortunei]
MCFNRIQKLLFSEYCDFEDMVLVESPFAQTTRDGFGIRQVQLGLTPTKLVLAVDILPPADESLVYCCNELDPEIETFELIAVYPIECVNLSVFKRKRRQSLKAHLCNNRILYFELGGFEKRNMFWNLWCERVQFLAPGDDGSCVSETSVVTSTSDSILNLSTTHHHYADTGKPQFWCKFGVKNTTNHRCKWVDKYLYMGSNETIAQDLKLPETDITDENKPVLEVCTTSKTETVKVTESKLFKINRFGNGVHEGCSAGLMFQSENCDNDTVTSTTSTDICTVYAPEVVKLSEDGVKIWEMSQDIISKRGRHPRRYGFMPQAHFLYGLGPYNVPAGDKYSTQIKRCMSAARIKCPPKAGVPTVKNLMTLSMSCETVNLYRILNIDAPCSKFSIPNDTSLLFWTPEYWCRPNRNSYTEFLEYVHNLRKQVDKRNNQVLNNQKRKIFKKKRNAKCTGSELNDTKMADENIEEKCETYLQKLRKALKMETALTAWDFDSTTLAYQLTMIDKELFLKIRAYELQIVLQQGSSTNAPNVYSFIAFSHRISCLIATEILREDSAKLRTRIIVRFINAAEKCDRIQNYQSCTSILNGLQSPPIYRLHNTWAYLRQHYAMKYRTFEQLCRRYSDTRTLQYQMSFYKSSRRHPYLPSIADIFSRLLNKVPHYSPELFNTPETTNTLDRPVGMKENESGNINIASRNNSENDKLPDSSEHKIPHKIRKFFSTFRIWPSSASENNIIQPQVLPTEHSRRNDSNEQHNPTTKYCYHDDDDQRLRLGQAIIFLEKCQKSTAKYAFTKHDLAWEYLRKARYRECTENFYFSFKLEQKISFI